jgi:pimeloyl-ACP methyl ester carboxylesterase
MSISRLGYRRAGGVCALIGITLFAGLFVASCSAQQRDSRPEDRFVTANGVRLHYLDWGGDGETLLFLTPLGGDLREQFSALAPQFTDKFRVLGLTRRGQEPSEKPESGYDIDTLVGDIIGFLDAMRVAQAHLSGHSVAGAEMTRLAGTHPARVSKLVYLDATADYKLQAEMAAEAGFGPPPDHAMAAILQAVALRHPEYERVKAPALNITVVFDGPIPVRPEDDEAYKRFVKLAGDRDVVGTQLKQFESGVARGETLILRNTTHGGFIHEADQQKIFMPAMREFLLRR